AGRGPGLVDGRAARRQRAHVASDPVPLPGAGRGTGRRVHAARHDARAGDRGPRPAGARPRPGPGAPPPGPGRPVRGAEMPPLIAIEHVTKRFPGVVALNDVSFDIRPGELHAVVGENGAGKSTLMKILSGVIPDYEGQVRLRGEAVEFETTRDA